MIYLLRARTLTFDLYLITCTCLCEEMSSSATAASPPPETPTSLLSPKEEDGETATEGRPLEEVRRDPVRPAGAGVNIFGELQRARQARNVTKPPTLVSKLTQAVLTTPLYPVRFVHVLIQLGYEPIPPQRRYSFLFQRYMYYWPGIIGYAKAIARQDGWRELYRGVGASLTVDVVSICATTLLSPLVKTVVDKIPLSVVPSDRNTPDNEDNIQTTRAVLVRGVRLFFHQLILRSAVNIIVQPFFTVGVRMIAQHAGKETLYKSVLSSLQEIYRREGIAGFYKGIVPALLGGVLATIMHVTIWVGLELAANMVTQAWGKTLITNVVRPFLVSYIPRSYSYPFELMRVVLSVNDSGLAIGMEPNIPTFNGWRDCFWHLKSHRLMYRGSVFYLPRYAYTVKP